MGRKDMKAKLWVIIGVLIIASIVMVAPVAAAESATAGTAVSGTLAKTVTLTPSAATGSITLTPGAETSLSTITLVASQNCAGTITAVDAMTGTTGVKNAGTAGYMTNYTAGGAYPDCTDGILCPVSPTKLAAPMKLVGTTAGVYSQAAQITDLSTAKTVYTISGGGSDGALGLAFSQLTALTDPVLPAGNTYRIPVTFTIGCT
jgi:hypothetical protein